MIFLIALYKEFLSPTQPLLPPLFSPCQHPAKRLGFSPAQCMELLCISLGGWRCEEARRAPAQTHRFPETLQESYMPFSEIPCKADLGTWGRSGPHLLSFRNRSGSAAGSLPRSPFWQDIGRARCCPTQRWSSCLDGCTRCPKWAGSVELKLGVQLGKHMH